MKRFKKIFAFLLAFTMILGFAGKLNVKTAEAAEGYTAFLMYSDRNWAYGNWDSSLAAATTTVNGEGRYTVKLNMSDVKGEATADPSGVMVLCVDVKDLNKDLAESGLAGAITDLEVLFDGKPIDLDKSKVAYGDIENNGNFRIEIYNEYGLTVGNPPFDPTAVAPKNDIEISFNLIYTDKDTANLGKLRPHTAFLMYTDSGWGYGNWNADLASATTTVTKNGNYSVTLNAAEVKGDATAPASGAAVFCVDVLDLTKDMDELNLKALVSNLKITADGTDIPVDSAKLVTGDIEENGNFRIEIYNQFGDSSKDPAFDLSALTFSDKLTVSFDLEIIGKYSDSEQTAFLMYTDAGWGYANWSADLESATTTVKGDGTYKVTLNAAEVKGEATAPASGAAVFCVDVNGLGNAVPDVTMIKAQDVKVFCDGKEIPVDQTKLVFGDIEENGNFRIEIYNQFGDSSKDPSIDTSLLTFSDTLSVEFKLTGIAYGAKEVEKADDPSQKEYAYSGEYHAYMGVQTNTSAWIFRNSIDDATYGIESDEWKSGLCSVTGDTTVKYAGTFTDAVITGDGKYSVKLTAPDFADETHLSLLYISTDMPISSNLKVTDVNVIINGKNLYTFKEGYLSPDSKTLVNIQTQNEWNSDIKNLFDPVFPINEIELTFTLSGMGYAKAEEQPAPTTAPEPTKAPEPTTAPAETQQSETTQTEAPETVEAKSSNTGLIVGIIIAIVLAAGCGCYCFIFRKKKETR